jgi:hypothetical protein
MTLNKIPVLDKGWISLLSTSITEEQLRELYKTLYRNRKQFISSDRIQVHMYIKSPIFVQLTFGAHGMDIDNGINGASGDIQAYIPTLNEIKARDLESSTLIAKDIEQTTEALLVNPKSYQMDACDIFISQVITPISVYNTYLVSANLSKWIEYIKRDGLPSPIEEYRLAIEKRLKAEWPSMLELFNGEKTKRRY